ncbi:MAG: hypothetical protein QNJ75_05065 [Acidimicrobiia bacterium]|nr:hypothetical protein [Acidimicrobiia bacterium]
MGQSIAVESKQIDNVCLFTTDRVLTGQDGVAYPSAEDAAAGSGFGAQLAGRLFASDAAIDHVYVAASEVMVRRTEAWDAESIAAAAQTVTDLHRFYE